MNASSVSVCSVTNIRCPLNNYACDQGKRQAVFSSSIFSSLHLKALKRLKGEVAVEQTEGGSRTACCFPKGSILLAYSVPIRLLTHSLNAPRTNTKPTYFIFHFQQISLAYWYKRLLAPEVGLGWKAPSRSAPGSSAVNLWKKKKIKNQKTAKVLLQCQHSREVTQWQKCRFKCLLKRCDSVCERIQPGGLDFM